MMSKEEAKIKRELLMLQKNEAPRTCSGSKGKEKEGDAQNGVLPKLPFDLEVEIFARVPCFQYWKLNLLSKKFSQLLRSGEIFKVKRERGLVQPYVLMFLHGQTCWTMFDQDFKTFRQLPKIPIRSCLPSTSDMCFGDKETVCAGTHLIVIGREMQRIPGLTQPIMTRPADERIVVWRYELEINRWIKDDKIITPRIYYASASRGTDAFFAGGIIDEDKYSKVANEAERYNSDTKEWKAMKSMHKRRQFCSGCYLRGKFYVVGGQDENNVNLTSGESYDEKTDSWTLIPDMLNGMNFFSFRPPLIAVVNDNLYLLETNLNELLVYDIEKNNWKSLGVVPVKVNTFAGFGLAFKGVGDRLIGASSNISVFTCIPARTKEDMVWMEIRHNCHGIKLNHYVRHCCIMHA